MEQEEIDNDLRILRPLIRSQLKQSPRSTKSLRGQHHTQL